MKEFEMNTKIVSGSGAIRALKSLGARRLLLVTDPYFMKNGTAARVAAAAEAEEAGADAWAACPSSPVSSSHTSWWRFLLGRLTRAVLQPCN